MSTPVVIVEYDAQWPAAYEAERARIMAAVGPHVVAIEHVGSTAVPGLASKPIIDIMLAVRCLGEVDALVRPLRELGYEYAPEFEELIPERRFFRKGPAHARTHHLHVVELHSDFWARHVLFRDYLRRHPGAARTYGELKRELAAEYAADRAAYTEAKTGFIREIEQRARTEDTG